MLKRVRWVGLGALLGAGGSVYAQVRMRRRARRWAPAALTGRARHLGVDVAAAAAEGRRAMREREAELRHRLAPPRR